MEETTRGNIEYLSKDALSIFLHPTFITNKRNTATIYRVIDDHQSLIERFVVEQAVRNKWST